MKTPSLPRVNSIDILRGLTMTLMIFVNDLWSLKNIPAWLEHVEFGVDGMGLADTVFPAFLFIVGMSVPFSISSRRSKGESNARIIFHILQRSFALLVMGVFLVNGETINEAASGISHTAYNTIACTCFVLLWNAYPASVNKKLIIIAKIAAIVALILMAWFYRSDNGSGFSHSWWGILGLIGWAYLVSAIVYTISGSQFIYMILFWLLCLACSMASHAHWIPRENFIRTIISPLSEGAMPALVTGGIITSMIFIHFRNIGKPVKLIGYLALISGALVAAGFYLRTFWGIAKLGATPAWVLICSALTIVTFLLIYWLADIQQHSKWFAIVKPAGTNTLTCYLLPYFAYALLYGPLGSVHLPEALLTGIPGLIKSLILALALVNIAGLLSKYGVRLKL